MATLVAKTVDPGGTGQYTSMSAAEAASWGASNANLTVSDEYCVTTLICTNGNADTAAVTIAGQTTDATRNITVTVSSAYRTPGTLPTSGNYYRLEVTGRVILITTNNVTLFGIPIKMTTSGSGQYAITPNGDNIVIDSCVLAAGNAAHESSNGIRASTVVTTNDCLIRNCVIYGFRGGIYNTGISCYNEGYAWTVTAYNNTIYDCVYGIGESSTTSTVKNNIVTSCTTDYSGTFQAASTNNIGEAAAELAFGATRTTGATTSATASKLNDTNKNFVTLGVRVGTVIKNTTDTTYTYVTAVDSATVLSVANDIFANAEGYSIYYNLKGAPTFFNAGAGDYHLVAGAANIAYQTGADLDGDAFPVTTDIDGQTRHATTPCIGADESSIYETACTEGAVFADANDYTYVAGGETVEAVAVDGATFGDSSVKTNATTQAISDGVKYGDAPVDTNATSQASADGFKASDSTVNAMATSQAASDGAVLGDSTERFRTANDAAVDGVAVGDGSANILATTQAATDGAKFTDATARTISVPLIASVAGTISDALAWEYAIERALAEGVIFTDAAANVFEIIKAAVDGVTFADSPANVLAAIKAATDGVTFTDTPSRTMATSRVTSDGVRFGDTPAAIRLRLATLTDGVIFADFIPGEGGGFVYEEAAVDGIAFSDATDRIRIRFSEAVDGVVFADATDALRTLLSIAIDGLKLTDAPSNTASLYVSARDGVKLAEAVAAAKTRYSSASDGVIFGDYAYRIKATELATGAVDITVTVTKPTVLVTAR